MAWPAGSWGALLGGGHPSNKCRAFVPLQHAGSEFYSDPAANAFCELQPGFSAALYLINWKKTVPLVGLTGMVTWFPTTPGTIPQLVLKPIETGLVCPRNI